MTKTGSAATATLGAPFTWTITVQNVGPSRVVDITLNDVLTGFDLASVNVQTIIGLQVSCTFQSAFPAVGMNCTVPPLNPGEQSQIRVTGTVNAAVGSTISNSATARGTLSISGAMGGFPVTATGTSPTVTVVAPDLTVTKVADVQNVAPGATFTYTITVRNNGTSRANNIDFTDALPAPVRIINVNLAPVVGAGSSFFCPPVSVTQPWQLQCNSGQLDPNASQNITVTVLVPADFPLQGPGGSQQICNQAKVDPNNTIREAVSVSDTAEQNNVLFPPICVTVTATVDLAISPKQLYVLDTQNQRVLPAVPNNGTVPPGAKLEYTFTVTVTGGTVNGVVVDDVLPPGVAFTNYAVSGGNFICALQNFPAPNTVRCTNGTVAPGPGVTFSIFGTATNNVPTTLLNQAAVNPNPAPAGVVYPPEMSLANNTTQHIATVNSAIDLIPTFLGITDVPAAPNTPGNNLANGVVPNGLFRYSFQIASTQNANNVAFRITLPPDFKFGGTGNVFQNTIPTNANPGFTCQQEPPANANPQSVICTGGTVPAGAGVTVRLDIPAFAGPNQGSFVANACVDPNNTIVENNANGTAETNNCLQPLVVVSANGGGTVVNLRIAKSATNLSTAQANPANILKGETLAYDLVVSNTGSASANGVNVQDPLPAGLAFISAQQTNPPVGGGVGFDCSIQPGTGVGGNPPVVMCIHGVVPAGGSVTIRITALVTADPAAVGQPAMVLTNTAVVDPTNSPILFPVNIPESNEFDNTSNPVSVTVNGILAADLTIQKTAQPPTGSNVPVGGQITYTLTAISNSAAPTNNVVVEDQLSASVTFVAFNPAPTNGFACALLPGNLVRCTGGTIAQGNNGVINIVVTVNNVAQGTQILNTAVIDPAGAIVETNEGNNTSNQTIHTVQGGLDLSITKTLIAPVAPALVAPGGQITWRIQVNNSGAVAVNNVVVQDNLDPNVTFVSATGSAGSNFNCPTAPIAPPNTFQCTGGTIPAAGNRTIDVVVSVNAGTPAGTNIQNNVVVDPADAIFESNEGNNTAQANIPVTVAGVDLTIAKTNLIHNVGPNNNVPSGVNTTYRVTVTNNNAQAIVVNNIAVQDILPAGTQFISVAPNANLNCPAPAGQTLNCAILTLAAGASQDIDITVKVTAAAGATLVNQATVDLPNAIGETNETNNNASFTNNVVAPVNLTITKALGPGQLATVSPNQNVTYTITVNAAGVAGSVVPAVVVRDALPNGITFVSATPSVGVCANTTQGNPATDVITCTGMTITVGVPQTITVVGRIRDTATGALVNQAEIDPANAVTETNETDNSSQVTVTVEAKNFTLTKVRVDPANYNNVIAPGPVPAGSPIAYRLRATQVVGVQPQTGVKVTDLLPAGISWVSTTDVTQLAPPGGGFDCATTGNAGTPQTVTCTKGTLNPGVPVDIFIRGIVVAPIGAVLTNIADLDPGSIEETNEQDNHASETSNVVAVFDLTVAKTVTPQNIAAGANVTWTVRVTSTGAGTVAGIKVVDVLPAGISFVSATPPVGSGFVCSNSGQTITCSGGTIASPGFVDIAVVGKVANNAATPLTNQVQVDPDNTIGETDEANNQNQAVVNVTNTTNLTIAKTPAVAGPVPSGSTQTHTVTVTNAAGGVTATNVKVVDTLPAGEQFINAVVNAPATGQCVNNNGVVTCTIDSIAAGANASIDITVLITGAAGQQLVNQAVVDPDNTIAELDDTDNTVTAPAWTVVPAINLTQFKTVTPQVIAPGATVTWTVRTRVSNALPTAQVVAGIVVRDTLDAGLTYVSATPAAGTGFNCVNPTAGNGQVTTCTSGAVNVPGAGSVDLDITFVARVAQNAANGAVLNNTATADPANAIIESLETDNTAVGVVNVNNQLDLLVTWDVLDTQYNQGQFLTKGATVTSNGAASSNITVQFNIPAGVDLSSIQPFNPTNGFVCGPAVGAGPLQVRCTGGSLAAAGTQQFLVRFTVTGQVGTDLRFEVTVDPDDVHTEILATNNNDTDVVAIVTNQTGGGANQPDLAFEPGSQLRLTPQGGGNISSVTPFPFFVIRATFRNIGQSTADSPTVSLEFTPTGAIGGTVWFPTGLTASRPGWTCNPVNPPFISPEAGMCAGPSLAPGESVTITYTGTMVAMNAGDTIDFQFRADRGNIVNEVTNANNDSPIITITIVP